MKSPASSRMRNAGRTLGKGAFIAMLVGLPAAVEFSDNMETVYRSTVQARTNEATALASPVRLTNQLGLTLTSGLVSSGASVQGGAGDQSATSRKAGLVVVDEAELMLDLGAPRIATIADGPGGDERLTSLAGLSVGALKIKRGTLSVKWPGQPDFQVTGLNASITTSRKSSYRLMASGRLDGQRVSLEATWSTVALRDGVSRMPVHLMFRSGPLEASFDGLLATDGTPTFTGHGELRVPSVRRLLAWVGFDIGTRDQFKAVHVAGPLEWSPTRLAVSNAGISIDSQQATGALLLKRGQERPSLDATLAFQELDLGRYLTGPGGPSGKDDGVRRLLTSIDADLRLSTAKVREPTLEMGRAAITIALNRGRLQADLASLELEGGSAGGQLTVDLNQPVPKAAVKLKLRGVDAGRMLASRLNRNALLGRTNVAFEGTAQGASVMEAMSGLAGRGNFELVEQGRLGLDIAALVYAARTSQTIGWSAAGKGQMVLDSLSGRFRVLNGALTLEEMLARSGALAIVGMGRLDVPGRLMDVTVSAGSAASTEAPITAREVLRLQGNWDNPVIGLVREPQTSREVEARLPGGHW